MFDSISSEAKLEPQAGASPHRRPVTVLLNRAHFEAAATRVLARHSGSEDRAVLHVQLQGGSGTGSVGMRMLNLVGNALRRGMRRGCAAYLGDAEFAILLEDTNPRETAIYARTMAAVIANLHVVWEGEFLSVRASIGAVMACGGQQGAALLQQARDASELARGKAGYRVHMLRESAHAVPPPQSGKHHEFMGRLTQASQ